MKFLTAGLLLTLWLFWRSADLAISYLRASDRRGINLVFGIGYAILAVLLLLVLIFSGV